MPTVAVALVVAHVVARIAIVVALAALFVGLADPCEDAATPRSPREVETAATVSPPERPQAAPMPKSERPLRPGEVLVVDPGRTGPGVSSLTGPDSLPPGAEKWILDRTFRGRVYLPDRDSCVEDGFAPRIESYAAGSFTRARARERLYLIWDGVCFAGHAEAFGPMTLAVFRDDDLVAKAAIEGGSWLGGVFDLDGDGVDEIVIGGGFTAQGVTSGGADLVELRGGKLATLRAFGQLYESSCGSVLEAPADKFVIVRAMTRRGAAPRFSFEERIEPCS